MLGAGSERRNESAEMIFLHLRRNITGAPKTSAPKKRKRRKIKRLLSFSTFHYLNFLTTAYILTTAYVIRAIIYAVNMFSALWFWRSDLDPGSSGFESWR